MKCKIIIEINSKDDYTNKEILNYLREFVNDRSKPMKTTIINKGIILKWVNR